MKIVNIVIINLSLVGMLNAGNSMFSEENSNFNTTKRIFEKQKERQKDAELNHIIKIKEKRVALQKEQQLTKEKLDFMERELDKTIGKLEVIKGTLQLNKQSVLNCFKFFENNKKVIERDRSNLIKLELYSKARIEQRYNEKFKEIDEKLDKCLNENAISRQELLDMKSKALSMFETLNFSKDTPEMLKNRQKEMKTKLKTLNQELDLIEKGKIDVFK